MKKDFDEKILTKELENARLEAEREGKEFNELWVPIYDKELKEKIDNCFEVVKEFPWTCEEIYKAEYSLPDKIRCNHLILKVSGGKNGNGNWNNYLNEMNKIFSNLKNFFNDVWLIDWKNDCLDDISYARIGAYYEG